jgi:hypothetical protein
VSTLASLSVPPGVVRHVIKDAIRPLIDNELDALQREGIDHLLECRLVQLLGDRAVRHPIEMDEDVLLIHRGARRRQVDELLRSAVGVDRCFVELPGIGDAVARGR